MPIQTLLSIFFACGTTEKTVSIDPSNEPDTNTINDSAQDSGNVTPTLSIGSNPRIHRLTHTQWRNAILDLVYVDASDIAETFLDAATSSGFENDADALVVDNILFQDYQRSAETVARQVLSDIDIYGNVVPEDTREGASTIAYYHRFEAESAEAVATTGGISGGHRYNLWANGTLTVQANLPASGMYTIRGVLSGSDCGDGIGAAMEYRLDGETIYTSEVLEEQELSISLEIPAGPHEIAVAFTNDCYAPELGFDRNLIIDWIEIEGGIDLGRSSITLEEMEPWVYRFLGQAFRRPLDISEKELWWNIFQQGASLYQTGDDIADGVQLIITSALQSPYFLYRIETTRPEERLSPYELAAKLSLQLCNQPPDEEIRNDLAQHVFMDNFSHHTERLLNSECGQETLIDMHKQLLHLDSFDNIFKTDAMWTPEINQDFKEELVQFLLWHIYTENGTLRGLYTADYTVANTAIAALYGVDMTESGFHKIDLPRTERSGLLTMVGLLSNTAETAQSSPIHRGVFINHTVLCSNLPPPPNVVPGLPPQTDNMTNRERVEAHTGAGTCGEGCHSSLINPPGFALENYDELGRYRTEDNGLPIDARASFYFNGFGLLSWNNSIEFTEIIADSQEAHQCYSQHLMRYYFGRSLQEEDTALLDIITENSRSNMSIQSLILAIVHADNFQYRGAQ